MKKIKLVLTEFQELRKSEYPLTAFESGKSVFIKHEDGFFTMYNKRYDNDIPLFENEFYEIHKYDKGKIILTRHDNLAQFFREEYGINAKQMTCARVSDVIGKTVYCGSLPHGFEHFAKEEYSYVMPNSLGSAYFESLSVEELRKGGKVHHTKFIHFKN